MIEQQQSRVVRGGLRCCRLIMEAGTKAFVSYVRAYKEHHCKFVFNIQVSNVVATIGLRQACLRNT